MNGLMIQLATPEDLNEISRIEDICFPPAEAAKKEVIAKRLVAFKDSFFIARVNDQIIGFVNGRATDSLVIHDELFYDAKPEDAIGENWCIFGLDVLPEYQNRGIAAKLMEHFIEAAKKHQKKRVLLTCKERLVPYYEKFGFVNDGLSKSAHGGAEWYDMTLIF
jgi:predicted N-acetyltransferase YhbS